MGKVVRWERFEAVYPYSYAYRGRKRVGSIEDVGRGRWEAIIPLGKFRSEKAAMAAVEKALAPASGRMGK